MEEEYGVDHVLRYRVRWCFLLMIRIRVKIEIVFFVTRICFWAYIQPEGLQCNFCENKKLKKNRDMLW